MRNLVTIRTINYLLEIAKKDRIELAVIDGWEVIVKKGEFKVGDSCVFFEIDSFLPDLPMYEFLPEKKLYKGFNGFRLKTMKLQGVVSQGLALPLDLFKDYNLDAENLTEELKVIKYDVSDVVSLNSNNLVAGKVKGEFPSIIPKTDQERIQNLTHYFKTKTCIEFEETLKLDGSSCTMYKIPGRLSLLDKIKRFFIKTSIKDYFGVCSRNLERSFKEDKVGDFWNAALKYQVESKLPVNYAVQGELIAPNIQSNHECVDDIEFYVFDIYDILNKKYLLPKERIEFMARHLVGVLHVPITGYYKVFVHHDNIHSLLKHVESESINPGTISEGRVYKAVDGSCTFKVISNQYLLKSEV